jgi:hypothetical protein
MFLFSAMHSGESWTKLDEVHSMFVPLFRDRGALGHEIDVAVHCI